MTTRKRAPKSIYDIYKWNVKIVNKIIEQDELRDIKNERMNIKNRTTGFWKGQMNEEI